jgi:hypothetical protein
MPLVTNDVLLVLSALQDAASEGRDERFRVTVCHDDGPPLTYWVTPHMFISALTAAVCEKMGWDAEEMRFLWRGERLVFNRTFAGYGSEDGDEIRVMQAQVGD